MFRRVYYDKSIAVDSLVSLCLRVVAKYITSNLQYSAELPPHLKSVLLTLLSRRGCVTHPVLRALIHRGLKTIDLSNCPIIQDAHLEALRPCSLLMSVQIPAATISKEALLTLFPNLPRLEQLDISACSSVDDDVINVLALNCPLLRQLTISRCKEITNAALCHLGRHLHLLEALDISYTEISDEGLEDLSQGNCRQTLCELYIDGCENLSADCGASLEKFTKLSNLSFCKCPELLESPYFSEFLQNKRVKNLSFTV